MTGFYRFIAKAWKQPKKNKELWRERLIKFRRENVLTKVDKPLRLDRARALGYKAKKGFVIIRVRVKRGGHRRPKPKGGRKPSNLTIRKALDLNYQNICERRAAQKYKNLEVLNSYWVAQDGVSVWYEIIMIDPQRPEIKNDKDLKWITSKKNKNRVFRGLTSSGRKSRGLRKKGKRRPTIKKRLKKKKRKAKLKRRKIKSKKGIKSKKRRLKIKK